MHIPDGFLCAGINTITYIIAVVVCVYAAKKISQDTGEKRILLMGIAAVFLLIAQMPNFPVTGVLSTHFLGAVLLASLLGPWASLLIMAIVLTIHHLIFGYGGLAALGTNIFNLGALGGIGGYYLLIGLKKLFPHSDKGFSQALAVATWLSIMMVTIVLWIELSVSGLTEAKLLNMLGIQSLVGIGEAIITVVIVSVLIKARPDLVITHCCGGDKDACYAHHHHVDTHAHEAGKEHDHGHLY